MTTPAPDATDLVRRRVINVVGHELRTPITTVRGLAELLVDAPADEAEQVILPALLRNARRTEELLDDLLIASEVKTAHPVEPPESVDLGALVDVVVEGTALVVVGPAPARAMGHPSIIGRALGHLVSNAEKYHDATPALRFESDAETVTVIIETPVEQAVRDLELGFEMFFRGEDAVTRGAGIGVGLPAARALARVDGGDVEIEQADGRVITRLVLRRAS